MSVVRSEILNAVDHVVPPSTLVAANISTKLRLSGALRVSIQVTVTVCPSKEVPTEGLNAETPAMGVFTRTGVLQDAPLSLEREIMMLGRPDTDEFQVTKTSPVSRATVDEIKNVPSRLTGSSHTEATLATTVGLVGQVVPPSRERLLSRRNELVLVVNVT